jgi:hypothetical protein
VRHSGANVISGFAPYDNLDIFADLPPIQSAGIQNNSQLYDLMASMLRNNPRRVRHSKLKSWLERFSAIIRAPVTYRSRNARDMLSSIGFMMY